MGSVELLYLWDETCFIPLAPEYHEIGSGPGGGFVTSDTLIVCAGSKTFCYKATLTKSPSAINSFQHFTHMSTERGFSASIPVDNGRLFVVGGEKYFTGETHKTSEYINLDGTTEPGPELPQPIQNMCFLKLSPSTAMLIGGKNSIDETVYNNSYFLDISSTNHEFSDGPPLIHSRQGHACGILILDNLIHVVVVSGSDGAGNYVTLTEHWKPNVFAENIFPDYPFEIEGAQVKSLAS